MQNKYVVIYNELAQMIQEKELNSGDTLPSEHELCVKFNTSRETIRKALSLLSQYGYIQKIRGKGSVVLDYSKFELPVSGLTSFKEISEQYGRESNTIVHKLYLEKAKGSIGKQLECLDEGRIWEVVRARLVDGERVILDKDYIREEIVPGLTKSVAEDSIYEYIEKGLNLNISFAKKEIVVEPVTEEDGDYLDLNGHNQVVVIRSYVYLADATVFQYTESRHRPDKFQFMDFARRTK